MKNLSPAKFTVYLLILSLALYGLLYAFFTKVQPAQGMPLFYMIPLLFAFTSLAYYIMVRTKNKNPRYFVYSFMLISMGRLMMYGGFVFIYALSHRDIAKPFTVAFLILYFIYTITEIRAVYGYFKS